MSEFRKELESLVNRHSGENGSNTPDFILADYLTDCLVAFDRAVNRRESWYGRVDLHITTAIPQPADPPATATRDRREG